jgi:hypothetical protein
MPPEQPTIEQKSNFLAQFESLAEKNNLTLEEKEGLFVLAKELKEMLGEKKLSQVLEERKDYNLIMKIQKKLKEIDHFLKEKELMPEVEIDLFGCDFFMFSIINKKIYIRIKKKNGKWIVINESGEEVGGEFKSVLELIEINKKLYFRAKKDNDSFVVANEKGEGISDEFQNIRALIAIDNKMFFVAQKDNEQWIVIDELGKQLGGEFKSLGELTEVNNKLYFKARKENEKWIVVGESGEEVSDEFSNIGNLIEINNKLYFIAKKENGKWVIINESGYQVSNEFKDIRELTDINNKLFFAARKEDEKWIIVTEGRESTEEYDFVHKLYEEDGKIMVVAEVDGKVVKQRILL